MCFSNVKSDDERRPRNIVCAFYFRLVLKDAFNPFFAKLRGKQILLLRVQPDTDNDLIEQWQRALNDVDVTDVNGIKRAGKHGDAVFKNFGRHKETGWCEAKLVES
jgi:hypothetical protein